MSTEPSAIPHGIRLRRNRRNSSGPIDYLSTDLEAGVAPESREARATSARCPSLCRLAFFDALALVCTIIGNPWVLLHLCARLQRFHVRLAERERTGVLTRRPLGAEQVQLLRRTLRARGVTWQHARPASERLGSKSLRVHSGDAFRPRFLAEQADRCASPPAGVRLSLAPPSPPGFLGTVV